MVARQFLREPYLASRAAAELGASIDVPDQVNKYRFSLPGGSAKNKKSDEQRAAL